jgi:hypothetical protein
MMNVKMMSPRKRMDMEGSGPTEKMAKGGMAKKGYAAGGMMKKGYAAGGVTRADGIIVKGHTKGKMV